MAKKENKTNAMRILETMNIKYEMRTYECDEFVDGFCNFFNKGIDKNDNFVIITIFAE